MKFIIEFLCIILISMIFVSIDLNNYSGECIINLENPQKISAFFLIVIHHIIATTANFGWLCYSKPMLLLFLITIITIMIIGFVNQGCFITRKVNKYCNLPDRHFFNDFFYIIGLKKHDYWLSYGHYIFYSLITIFAIYKFFIL